MPTSKQRRRRDKDFRHDVRVYEVDDEGNEVPDRRVAAPGEPKPKVKPAQQAWSGERRAPITSRHCRRGIGPSSAAGLMGGLMLVAFLYFLKSGPLRSGSGSASSTASRSSRSPTGSTAPRTAPTQRRPAGQPQARSAEARRRGSGPRRATARAARAAARLLAAQRVPLAASNRMNVPAPRRPCRRRPRLRPPVDHGTHAFSFTWCSPSPGPAGARSAPRARRRRNGGRSDRACRRARRPSSRSQRCTNGERLRPTLKRSSCRSSSTAS